ncbi:hypothetical protein C8Q78DRAFT_991412 [Trametes maxima]|nr:hypothetical protein C8Q78DRAFT_991412 [Trametes maxima]
MARQKWTTPEQRAWLEKRIPGFVEAQQTQSTYDFFIVVAYEWFKQFPMLEPTEEELKVAHGNRATAISVKKKAEKQRVTEWFYNNTRLPKSNRPINLKKRKTGYLHPYQAYMKLYKDRVMPSLKEKYVAYLSSLAADETPVSELAFNSKMAKEMLRNEPQDVQDAIEEFREQRRIQASTDLLSAILKETTPSVEGEASTSTGQGARSQTMDGLLKELNKNIDSLPATIQDFLVSVRRVTGWAGYAIFAGPHPRTGLMTTVAAEIGTTLEEGLKFSDVSLEDWKAMEKAFATEIESALHQIMQNTLEHTTAGTGDAETQGEKTNSTHHTQKAKRARKSSKKGKAKATTTVEPAAPATAALEEENPAELPTLPQNDDFQTRSEHPDSEEELNALENIERANAYLDALKEKYNYITGKPPTSNLDGNLVGRNNGTDGSNNTTSGGMPSVRQKLSPPQAAGSGMTTPPTDGSLMNEQIQRIEPTFAGAYPPLPSGPATVCKIPSSPKSTLMSHQEGGESGNRVDTHLARSSTPGMMDASVNSMPASSANDVMESQPSGRSSISEEESRATQPQASKPVSELEVPGTDVMSMNNVMRPQSTLGTLDVAGSSSTDATHPGSTDLERDLERDQDQDVNMFDVDSPAWISESTASLLAISNDPRWVRAVGDWVRLEKAMGYPEGQGPDYRLRAKHRPIQVGQWLKTRKYTITPAIPSVTQYGVNWRLWWAALQPSDRSKGIDDNLSCLPRKVLNNDAWAVLKRGGPNGLFIALISLGWWIGAADNGYDLTMAYKMVDDFVWVLSQIALTLKNSNNGDDDKNDDESIVAELEKPPRKWLSLFYAYTAALNVNNNFCRHCIVQTQTYYHRDTVMS